MLARLLWVAVLGACAGKYGGEPPQHPTAPAKPGETEKIGRIEDAALPYSILDPKTGHEIDANAFWDRLAKSRVVCVGEEHSNPHHHWFQLEVVKHLAKSWPHFALGMEMVQRPFQGVLDDYAAKKIDAAALRSRTGWEDRWGFDFGFYGPTMDAAVNAHAALLALNASRELTKKIAHHGLGSLTPEERAQLPAEIVLNDAKHRAWFDAMMSEMSGGGDPHSPHGAGPSGPAGSGGPGTGSGSGSDATGSGMGAMPEMPTADNVYAVQVTWDESMADGAAKWLAANKDGHVIILAGSGHCHDSGIVNRLRRRGYVDAVSTREIVDDGEGGVSDELAKPNNDFLIVLTLPKK
ncbi:MAG TPA: ChaN family lipoprotein [Kofleriaceae bacterium]